MKHDDQRQAIPSGSEFVAVSEAPPLPKLTAADDAQIVVVDPPSLMPLSGFGERFKGDRTQALRALKFMEAAWGNFTTSCVCGTSYANNCAHFLSNACVLTGNLPKPFPGGAAKCPSGRLIRAKEMLDWFRSFSTAFAADHRKLTSGYWFVYQEDSSGQGHVCFHHEDPVKYAWKGTNDYDLWPVQWHYFY